ncbi:hypothetical protein [Halomonas sp. CSM-2]|uniref:hypothetical protein n=1 Tax=Halomonas sp. CSM-2 TaxID=1975722 RepID=UPI000A285FE4|nr:hypothetical protein [Halomonas sp. CSM-2]
MSNNFLLMEKRQLIPRWHASRKALSLQYPTLKKKNVAINSTNAHDPWLEEARKEWDKKRTVFNAVELNVALFMNGMYEDAGYLSTLSFLLDNYNMLAPGVKSFINSSEEVKGTGLYALESNMTDLSIRNVRGFLKRNPRDVFSWVDMAFYYTVKGEDEKAYKCLKTAWSLNKYIPFVARSFARFLVHKDNPEEALWVLNRSEDSRNNPLLTSAHISIANSFELPSARVNDGKKILKNFSGDMGRVSDLAASLGTIEFENGNLKKAKKMFQASLLVPSENALSQYGWLKQKHGFSIDEEPSLPDSSIENDANKYYVSGDFSRCRDKLVEFHSFQPFSDASMVDAGYMSLIGLKDPTFVTESLYYKKPKTQMSFGALNNLIVAKLLQNNFHGIESDFKLLAKKAEAREESAKGIYVATSGLMMFKIGEECKGAELYESAIEFFKKRKDERAVGIAEHFYSQNVKHHNNDLYAKLRSSVEATAKKKRMLELLVEW